jgi:hypothetical protein
MDPNRLGRVTEVCHRSTDLRHKLTAAAVGVNIDVSMAVGWWTASRAFSKVGIAGEIESADLYVRETLDWAIRG